MNMRLLDFSFKSPAENLALDEVLLDMAESGGGEEILRFWESPVVFVVLGVSQPFQEALYEEACQQEGVPVLRRCTAGGCVLQGPGCLNYSLVLKYEGHPETRLIRESNQYILGRITSALGRLGIKTQFEPPCDLSFNGRKVSGNAQKRRKNALLHHGTLLCGFDVSLMPKYLREPTKRPPYRGQRIHGNFVGSLGLDPLALRGAIAETFGASNPPEQPQPAELEATHRLATQKYLDPTWIRRC